MADDSFLDTKVSQLLNELRNTLLGVQVLLAGLLGVPFSQRFSQLEPLDRAAYLLAVVGAGLASTCLIAPAQYHRLRWRHRATDETMRVGRVLANVGSALLALTVVDVAFLLVHLVNGTTVAAGVAGTLAALIVGLWFVLPLVGRPEDPAAGE